MQVHITSFGVFFRRRSVDVLVSCQRHYLPSPVPKVLRILRATPQTLQRCLVVSIVRWPIEAYPIPKLYATVLIEHLGIFLITQED
jgi:hypothetical protein